MFKKTLVHEFHISYRYTEQNLLSPFSENGDKIWKQSAVELKLILLLLENEHINSTAVALDQLARRSGTILLLPFSVYYAMN